MSPVAALRYRAERVAALGARLEQPLGRRLATANSDLAHAESGLARGARFRMDRVTARLDALGHRLEALSPLSVLGRGYSLTTTTSADGREVLVRDATDVAPGDTIRTRLSRGAHVDSRVERVDAATQEDT